MNEDQEWGNTAYLTGIGVMDYEKLVMKLR